MVVTLSSSLGVEDIDVVPALGFHSVIRRHVLSTLNHGAEYVDVSTVDSDNVVWTERRIPESYSDNGSVWSTVVMDRWHGR